MVDLCVPCALPQSGQGLAAAHLRCLARGRLLAASTAMLCLLPVAALPATSPLPDPAQAGEATSSSRESTDIETQGKPLPVFVPKTDTAEVRLVRVPVTVLDANRQSVLDLTRDDFQLLVDGRAQHIVTFDPPSADFRTRAAVPPMPVAGSTDAHRPTDRKRATDGTRPTETRRWAGAKVPISTALVIDLYQSRLISIESALGAARDYLQGGMPPSTETGLFIVTHGAMRTVAPFTTDSARLLTELEAVAENLALRDSWLNDEPARQAEIGAYGLGWSAMAAVQGYSNEQAARSRHVLHAVEALAAAMALRPGRKNVVFIGDGLREQAGMNYVGGILGAEDQPTGLGMARLATRTASLREEFRETMRIFREAGVTLSPVSMVGLYNQMRLDPDAWGEMLGSMQGLARETGGRRPVALNGFSREVEQAAVHVGSTYVLGFRPLFPDYPGTRHTIRVRVSERRLMVSARSEYIQGSRNAGFRRSTLFAGATLLPEEFNDLPIDSTVRLFPAPEKTAELHLQISLPIEAIAWRDAPGGRRVAELEISGVLRGGEGSTRLLFDTGYRLDVDANRPPERVVIQAARTVKMPRDPDLVVVVQDRTSDRLGTAVLSMPLIRKIAPGIRMSAPAFLSRVEGVYLLTPTGKPLLGLYGNLGLFIPTEPGTTTDAMLIALARVDGLPDGSAVRFCAALDTEPCAVAGWRPYEPPAGDSTPPPPETWQQTRTAWMALDPELAAEAGRLVLEIVDSGPP